MNTYLTYIILYLAFSSLLISVLVIARRLEKRRSFRLKRKAESEVQSLLVKLFILGDRPSKMDRRAYDEYLKLLQIKLRRKSFRDQLTRELLASAEKFSGDDFEKFRSIFIALELNKYTLQKLYSGNEVRQIKGLQECKVMDIKTYADRCTTLTSSPKAAVRLEAYLTLMRIQHNNLNFLSNPEVTLNVWEAMCLENELEERLLVNVPDFTQWLTHPNKDVVNFAQKMMRKYGQLETYSQMNTSVRRTDQKIRQISKSIHQDSDHQWADLPLQPRVLEVS